MDYGNRSLKRLTTLSCKRNAHIMTFSKKDKDCLKRGSLTHLKLKGIGKQVRAETITACLQLMTDNCCKVSYPHIPTHKEQVLKQDHIQIKLAIETHSATA